MLSRRLISIGAVLLLAAGCSSTEGYSSQAVEAGEEGPETEQETDQEPGASPNLAPGSDEPTTQTSPLVVHEWGTFTSVQSSRGETLEGMHHEEEALPPFVHARDIGSPLAKRMETLPEGVTQKLETPVIYFHGGKAGQVTVDVDFPEGVISEWYPEASSFAPAVGEMEQLGEGRMSWEVELLDRSADLVPVAEEDVWAPSREVDARPIRVGIEEERFIFYRGLARFEVPLRVQHVGGEMTVTNNSDQEIPAAFLLHVHEEGGSVTPLGPVPARDQIVFSPSPKERDLDLYVDEASGLVRDSIVETGLYRDEAQAMVDTWRQSYFYTRGLRLLYIVPREWTDALLPIEIEPEPAELVRTLVGRVEVMTDVKEARLAERIEAAAEGGEALEPEDLGRFAEPKLRRTLQLLDDPQARSYCQDLIDRASAMP